MCKTLTCATEGKWWETVHEQTSRMTGWQADHGYSNETIDDTNEMDKKKCLWNCQHNGHHRQYRIYRFMCLQAYFSLTKYQRISFVCSFVCLYVDFFCKCGCQRHNRGLHIHLNEFSTKKFIQFNIEIKIGLISNLHCTCIPRQSIFIFKFWRRW